MALTESVAVTDSELDVIVAAYVTCALWSSIGEDGTPLDDNYGADDLSAEAADGMAADVADFVGYVRELGIDWLDRVELSQFGHDFWLTRNGHGAGFWDRGLGELGERLTAAAKTFGGSDLYVGDDGQLYV